MPTQNDPMPGPPSAQAIRQQARHKQIDQLYSQGFTALIAMPAAALLLFAALKTVYVGLAPVLWFAGILAVSSVRGVLLYAYSTSSRPNNRLVWARYYDILEVSSGILWGCSGYFLSEVPIEFQLLILFALVGMVGGASTILAPVFSTYISFAIPAMGIFCLFLFQLPGEAGDYMGALSLLAMIILPLTTRILSRNIQSSLILAIENEALSTQALKSNESLEREIRARNDYENKLKASQDDLNRIIANMQDTYYRTDLHGDIIKISPSISELLGYTPQELYGTKLSDYYMDPHGREKFLKMLEDSGGELRNYEAPLRHRDGHTVWVSTDACFYRDDSGKVLGVEGTTRSISEKKAYIDELMKSRETIRTLNARHEKILENAPIGILFIDKDTTLSYINPNMQTMLGVPTNSPHMMIGQKFMDIPAIRESGVGTLFKQLLQGNAIVLKLPYTSTYGKKLVLSVSAVPLNEDGEFSGAIILAEDISEEIQREQEILHAKKIADTASNAKNRIMANISHELRTPLNSIIGMATLMLNSAENEEQGKQIKAIKESGESLLALVNTVLNLSDVEHGTHKEEIQAIEVSSFVVGTLSPSIKQAEKKGLDFVIHADSNIPLMLLTDPYWLGQILHHLVENAVKFTKQGCITVNIGVHKIKDNQVTLHFAIQDTGIGMSEDEMSVLFEHFSKKDSSISREHAGIGLGATIAKQLIESRDGKIWVESQPNQGSTFHFTFPMDIPSHSQQQSIDEQHARKKTKKKLHILIAEDDDRNRLIITKMVESLGHSFQAVANGQECIDAYGKEVFDLILMDIRMPIMDGITATQKIRQTEETGNRRVPILATTAHAMRGDRQRLLDSGLDDYIIKPIMVEELQEKIQRLVST